MKLLAGAAAVARGTDCKVLHLMRHGEALVNVAGRKFPKGDPRKSAVRQDPQYFDSPLSERGLAESVALGAGTLEGRAAPPRVELVLASPLTRALQTATSVFGAGGGSPAIHSLEALREFNGKAFQPCDSRRGREELEPAFPHVDFTHVPRGADTLLAPGKVESPDNVDARLRWLLGWVHRRPERQIACVAHFQVLSRLLGKHLAPAGWDPNGYGDLTNLEIRSVPVAFS